MASKQSENTSQGRPKRTRAKFPKVRTGCLTCKIRHKKCDEAKPFCQRCRDYGYKCDGYEQPQEPRCPKKKPQATPTSQAMVTSRQGVELVHAFNNLGSVHGSHPEKSLFLHANHCTIKDLIGFSTSLSGFWRDYVLPIGHTISPVRHALISLGASHKSFLLKRSPGMPPTETLTYDNLAIQQYNKAITDLTPIMSDPSPLDVQAILICCLIFVCIDNLNGRHAVAMRHLRAGADLLTSMQDPAPVSPATEASTPGQLTRTKCDISTLGGISDMFERLSLDTSILMEDQPVHRQSFRRFTTDDTQGPFLTSSAARDELRRIDVEFHELWCPSDSDSCCTGSPDSKCGQVSERLCPDISADCPGYQRICDRFDSWLRRFDQYLESINHTPASDGEFNEAMVLTLHRQIWLALLKQGPCCDNALDRKDFEDILHQADLVIPIVSTGTQPVFTFEADTIPPVSFVASFCDDDDLRRRAIAMLRTINRTEGVWDSQRMADLCETELATGMCTGENSPSGVMDCQGLCIKERERCRSECSR